MLCFLIILDSNFFVCESSFLCWLCSGLLCCVCHAMYIHQTNAMRLDWMISCYITCQKAKQISVHHGFPLFDVEELEYVTLFVLAWVHWVESKIACILTKPSCWYKKWNCTNIMHCTPNQQYRLDCMCKSKMCDCCSTRQKKKLDMWWLLH